MGSMFRTVYTPYQAEEEDGLFRGGGYLHKATQKPSCSDGKKHCSVSRFKRVHYDHLLVDLCGYEQCQSKSNWQHASREACSSSELVNTVVLHINLIYIFKLLWSLTSAHSWFQSHHVCFSHFATFSTVMCCIFFSVTIMEWQQELGNNKTNCLLFNNVVWWTIEKTQSVCQHCSVKSS